MSTIPINPASISGAVPFNVQGSAIPCNIADRPPEGHAFIPMQIGFFDAPVKYVDLTSITPTRKFSKISTLYIDATNSLHDINILFPDTGFETRVAFGDTAMIPVLSSNIGQKFYVILDNGGATNTTDTVNVFALNFFVPPALTSIYQRAINYGYSSMFNLQPTFTQSAAFQGYFTSGAVTLIPNTQWFITGLSVSLNATGTGGITLALADNGTTFFNAVGSVNAGNVAGFPNNVGGLNYISSNTGHLTATLILSGTAAPTCAVNIFGGVLVT